MTRPVRRALMFTTVRAAAAAQRALLATPLAPRAVRRGGEAALWRLGAWRAWLAIEQARRQVPAYRTLTEEAGTPEVRLRGLVPDLTTLPITDKEGYVRRFSIEQRCVGGALPRRGVVIDESSGTSGEPSNWVRGRRERRDGKRMLYVGMRRLFGDEPPFVINAFALGPWATGMAVAMAAADIAVLKATGPDIAKIEATLKTFGPGRRYLICGYPPFLKQLVDTADVDWSRYRISAAVGGEGMSEALRDHLLTAFERVVSSFGASDLEINIAIESDLTIALRRLLAERPEAARRLGLPEHGTLPMVFQYNPFDHHIETTEAGELVITVCRAELVSPKLRYNLRDLGCVVRYRAVRDALLAEGLDPMAIDPDHLDLPFLFHYGRADSTAAFYGANIAPAEIEEIVFADPALAPIARGVALIEGEDDAANKQLTIAIELNDQATPPPADAVRVAVLEVLARRNQDFREAARFMPAGQPALEFHDFGSGPFAGYDIRLKRIYIHR